MNLSDMTFKQVKEFIHNEHHQKGRPMREVIDEVVAVRDDFILLPANPEIVTTKLLEALDVSP